MEHNEKRQRRLLESAHRAWIRLADTRERRRRYARYTYGDQWGDTVTDSGGRRVTERDLYTFGGRQPLSNNLIRRMVKAVVGRYRTIAEDAPEGTTPDGEAFSRCSRLNRLDELDARTLEEFLISGMAIHRVVLERRSRGLGVWVDPIRPDRFFINAVADPRLEDTELIGCLTDMSMRELLQRFGGTDPKRREELERIYGTLCQAGMIALGDSLSDAGDFFHAPAGRCRVIEVWTLENRERLMVHDPRQATLALLPRSAAGKIERENSRRRKRHEALLRIRARVDTRWVCTRCAPDGTVLDTFESPLPGGSHPFAVRLYPLVDGDVHSLVEDVIDQQRHINRLISVTDRMMNTAAKGVLLFPEQCKLDIQSWEQLGAMWADPGGVIPYRPHMQAQPQQIVTPIGNFGAQEMLRAQINLFEEVSGVGDTLMGKTVSGAVGVDRYESEVRNASAAINDLLKTFADFAAYRNSLIAELLI